MLETEALRKKADFIHEIAMEYGGEEHRKLCGVADTLRQCANEIETLKSLVKNADKVRACAQDIDHCFIDLCEVCGKKCENPKDALAFDLKARITAYDKARVEYEPLWTWNGAD